MDAQQASPPPGPAPGQAGVDPERAAAFLAARFGPGIAGLTRLGHGEWSTAYAFRHAGANLIVRFGAYPEDFHKDRLAARYATPELPIPAVVEIGEVFGGHYAVSERFFGGYLDELDGERMAATLPSLFAALDAARAANLSATSGYGGWGADGNGAYPSWRAALLDIGGDEPGDRTAGWRTRLASFPARAARFDEAHAALQSLLAYCPEARHLIHSDLLHYNVLVADDRLAAVFDWGCSLCGDFLYDPAWFAFWAPWFPAWRPIDFQEETRRHFAAIGQDVPHFDERMRAYHLHIGLDSMRYNAFKEDWDGFDGAATRTAEFLSPEP